MSEQRFYLDLDFSAMAKLFETGTHKVSGLPRGCRYIGSERLDYGRTRLLFALPDSQECRDESVTLVVYPEVS